MNGTVTLEEPLACAEAALQAFAHLVRQGFDGSDDGLDDRIRRAKLLAFHFTADDMLGAVAGLKAPCVRHRAEVFKNAHAHVDSAIYRLELGWVFVIPDQRGNRIGETLCQLLLEREPRSGVFATTRPNNTYMIRILLELGFERVGSPYSRRNEQLALYLRS